MPNKLFDSDSSSDDSFLNSSSEDESGEEALVVEGGEGGAGGHDPRTGALTVDHVPPETSASDHARFLRKPEYKTHPFGYPAGLQILVGGLGTGKSSAIYGILQELDEVLDPKARGRVIYYSGSAGDKILDAYDSRSVEKYDPKSKESFLGAIREIIDESGTIPHNKKRHHVIVIEDAVNDSDILPRSIVSHTPVSRLMMSCRHTPCTIIMSAQKYSALPSFARSNANHLYAFRSKCDAELKALLKDVNFSKEEFIKGMDSLTEAGQFLWLQNHSRRMVKGWSQPMCR